MNHVYVSNHAKAQGAQIKTIEKIQWEIIIATIVLSLFVLLAHVQNNVKLAEFMKVTFKN